MGNVADKMSHLSTAPHKPPSSSDFSRKLTIVEVDIRLMLSELMGLACVYKFLESFDMFASDC